ncbi:PREDICTED: disrupted in schizophrenia 1 homolog, partial [Merops nubicus]|uniref:disrupted in schizophrenia 1 homolog n=1 Tax=Merops nubicus TaxID=57421 RepID=UPI0004F09D22
IQSNPRCASESENHSGSERLKQGDQGHLMSTGSLRKKKLARRPGYMRPEAQRQIEFQSLGACKPFSPEELKHGRQHCGDFEKCSLQRRCQNNFDFLQCSAASSAVAPAHGLAALATTGSMPGHCQSLQCCKSPRSEDTVIAVYPAAATSKGDVSVVCCTQPRSHSTKLSKAPNVHALDQTEVNNNCDYQNGDGVSRPVGAHDSFSSSFSFIQLSLNLASGVNDAEGRSTSEEADYLHPSTAESLQKPEEMVQTCERLGTLHGFSRPTEDLECENETTANCKPEDCETVSLSDTDATFSYSTDSSDATSAGSSVTSGYESSFTVSEHNWDTLMKKYEPVLQDCLLGNRNTLKIKSLILRLQRLQEKAVEEDDYDRGENCCPLPPTASCCTFIFLSPSFLY